MTGQVGVPGRHERKCPDCDGNGQLATYTGQFPTGYRPCDTCDATGVVPVMVPTISLWQPWASLIFTGDKVHETRAYPPPEKHVGQRIGIHAAKALPKRISLGLQLLVEREFGADQLRYPLPRGAVIGTARLVGFGPTEDVEPFTVANRIAGDWTPGRWAWRLDEPVRLINPLPWRGKQGWFYVPEADLGRVPKCQWCHRIDGTHERRCPAAPPVDTGALKRSITISGDPPPMDIPA